MGGLRSILERNAVKFTTSVAQNFGGTVNAGSSAETTFNIPVDTVQIGVHIAWGDMFSPNDLALKVFDANGVLRGESNFLNAPGLTGKREDATTGAVSPGIWRTSVNQTGGIGTAQSFFGTVETTRVEYANLIDWATLPTAMQSVVKSSLRSFLMLPDGNRFRPNAMVSRFDLAAALVRGGRVPQYLAQSPVFTDANDLTTRTAIESVQKSPNGKIFYDAANGSAFRPDNTATRLVAAVALVRAANLQSAAQTAVLSPSVSDYSQIPSEYRGHVAVALQKGFLSLDGNQFAPNRALSRLELAQAMVGITNLAIQ